MINQIKNNTEDYGVIRKKAEGNLYLMVRLSPPNENWAEEVAVKSRGKWKIRKSSKYRVLWTHVQFPETKEEKIEFKTILNKVNHL